MAFLIPIIITIAGLGYIFSPWDFIPDFIPIIGWSDDFLVFMLIIASWLISFGMVLVDQLFPFLVGALVIVGLIFLIKYLKGIK